MTISPAQVEAQAVELGRLYSEAELAIIQLLQSRLAAGMAAPAWAEIKLAELTALRREIEAVLAGVADAGYQQLALDLGAALEAGVNGALADLGVAGIRATLPRTNVALAEALLNEAALGLQSTHLGILRQALDGYRDAVAEGLRLGAVGVETRRQATQRILDELAKRGLSGFVDSAGRHWEASTYAEMTARTGLGRAAVQGHLNTLVENGQDLVIVSDAPENCPICAPWEGRVLSLSGRTAGRFRTGDGAEISVAGTVGEATSAGLFHPNCRHSVGIFVPGLTKRQRQVAEREDAYEERQRQRQLERHIRSWKRRETAAMTPEAKEYAKRHREQWQSKMRDFVKETDRRRQYAREQVTAAT